MLFCNSGSSDCPVRQLSHGARGSRTGPIQSGYVSNRLLHVSRMRKNTHHIEARADICRAARNFDCNHFQAYQLCVRISFKAEIKIGRRWLNFNRWAAENRCLGSKHCQARNICFAIDSKFEILQRSKIDMMALHKTVI
jgi:hypothetical protein